MHGRARLKDGGLAVAGSDGVGGEALFDGDDVPRLTDNSEGTVVGGG